jgi:hypothetical protein
VKGRPQYGTRVRYRLLVLEYANGSRKYEGASDQIASPSYWLVAGARNHLPANRPLEFSFEIGI